MAAVQISVAEPAVEVELGARFRLFDRTWLEPGVLSLGLATFVKEGRQMSLLTTGFALGIAMGPLLAGFVAVLSFELPFWVGAALALGATWVVWRKVPETVGR